MVRVILLCMALSLGGCQAGQPRQLAEEGLEAGFIAMWAVAGSTLGPVGTLVGGMLGALWMEATDSNLEIKHQEKRTDSLTYALLTEDPDVQKFINDNAKAVAKPWVLGGMGLLVFIYIITHPRRFFGWILKLKSKVQTIDNEEKSDGRPPRASHEDPDQQGG